MHRRRIRKGPERGKLLRWYRVGFCWVYLPNGANRFTDGYPWKGEFPDS